LETVCLGGNNLGEQLLSENIEDFIDKSWNIGTKINLITNGTLLKDALLDKIVEKVSVISISAEGAGENYYKIRHVDYKIFKNNIETLIALRNKKGSNLQIIIAYTAFKSNLEDLFTLLKLGVDGFTISYVYPKNLQWQQRCFTPLEIKKIESDFMIRFVKEANLKNVKVDHRKVSAAYRADCVLAWTDVSITELGDVFPCCVADNSLRMGNIRNKPFRDVWNGRRFVALRKSFVGGKLLPRCKKCYGVFDPVADNTILKKIRFFLIKHKLRGVLEFLFYIRDKTNELRDLIIR
jgi:radical SAM protein with 4Fe4S-binding SPASM domain